MRRPSRPEPTPLYTRAVKHAHDDSLIQLLPPLPRLEADAKVVLAYSGGLDSTVLLHLLATRGTPGLQALHVHHGLQAAADDWVAHCAAFCVRLQVPLILYKVRIDANDPAGPEAAAREARYAALREELHAGDLLVTAHHRDDQVETVLLRLLRGSGVDGLAAMRALTEFAPGRLWRPLLDTPRETLRRYAETQGLTWIEDPHNQDRRYARSWLREELLPGLRQRFPQTDVSLARSARLAAEAAELLAVLAASDSAAIAHGATLSVSGLLNFTATRRHNLLRHWLRGQGFEPPSADMLDRIDAEMLTAATDAEPLLGWSGCELRRYRDALFVLPPLPPPDETFAELWSRGTTLTLPPGCGLLRAEAPPPRDLKVRVARAGEMLKPAGSKHRRTVKNLFQEAGTPPWLRLRAPLLELDGESACIPGVAATAEWRALLAETGWRAHWEHNLTGYEVSVAL